MIHGIARFVGFIYFKLSTILQRCRSKYFLSVLKHHGSDCHIGAGCSFINLKNISIGNSVSIGDGSCFMAAEAEITIGNHVMIAPGCSIVTGNHRINVIGKYMDEVSEKEAGDDLPVMIEDDVWIGKNAIILKGVTVGKGSVIGAGSIITKSVPPYTIAFTEAKLVTKPRFTEAQIDEHQQILSKQTER